MRVEDPEVFEATHAKVLRLLHEGVVDGLRVDHPDGLADPDAYLRRLHEATGGRWTVVEKILADGEHLPAAWPVAGTTGYDALRHIDGLFTDPAGVGELLGQYRRFAAPQTDRGGDWEATVRRAAYKVLTHELAAEVDRLTRVASRAVRRRTGPRAARPRALGAAHRAAGAAGPPARLPAVRLRRTPPPVRHRGGRGRGPAAFVGAGGGRGGRRRTRPGAGAGRGRARAGWSSGRGSRRPRRRCAPSPSRTRRSTAMCRCCRRPRWAATRAAPRCPRRTSTRTARACSATGRRRGPCSPRTTPSAAPTYGRRWPCSPSARSAGRTCWPR